MPQFDPRTVLDPLGVDKSIKHDAWEAFQSAQSPDDFKQRFDKLDLPREAKRALWDGKFGSNPSDVDSQAPVYGPPQATGPTHRAARRNAMQPSTEVAKPLGSALQIAQDRLLGTVYPEALATADQFLNTPLGTGHSLTKSYGPRLKAAAEGGGLKGMAADTAKLGAGLADFLASPAGIATSFAEIATGGAITPWIGGAYAANETLQAAPAIQKAIKQPSPDNLQEALLHTGMAGLLGAGAARYRRLTPFEQPTVNPPETPTPAAFPQPEQLASNAPAPPRPAGPAPVMFSPLQPNRPESEHPVPIGPDTASTSSAHQVLDALQGQRAKDIANPDRALSEQLREARIEATRRQVENPPPTSPEVQAARDRVTAMQARVNNGEISQAAYQTWFRTGKLPEAQPLSAEEQFQKENFQALSRPAETRGTPLVPQSAAEFTKTSPFVYEPKVGPQFPHPDDALLNLRAAVAGLKGDETKVPADQQEFRELIGSAKRTPTQQARFEELQRFAVEAGEADRNWRRLLRVSLLPGYSEAPTTPLDRVTEPVQPRAEEPEAILMPPKEAAPAAEAKPLSFYQDKMLSAWDRAKKAQATPEKLPWAKQSLANAFGELAKAATGHEDEVAAWFRKDIPHLEELHNYLKSHLDARSTINDIQQKLYDKLAAWGGTHMIDPSTGLGSREPGVSHAVREVLGTMMGNRRVEVPDEKAVIPEGDLPPHILEAKEQLAKIKEAISGGMLGPNELDDAIDESKLLEELTSEYDRPALKTHGHPTKEAVALAKGLSPEELAVTGAGKAISINHGGLLPVMTSAIWENEYGGPKGKFSPAPELRPPVSKKGPFKPGEFEALEAKKIGMILAKLSELQAEIDQRQTFAKTIEQRKNEAGVLRVTGAGVAPQLSAEIQDLAHRAGTHLEGLHDWVRKWFNSVSDDPKVANPAFDYKAEVDKNDFYARQAVSAHLRDWQSRSHDETIDFTDKVKYGDLTSMAQPHREFVEGIVRPLENKIWTDANNALLRHSELMGSDWHPLAYLENHDRIMWKGPVDKVDAAWNRSRSMAGTRGFLKPHTLEDMSEGIAKGLTPITWNPVENFLMAWHDSFKFISDLKMFDHYIEQGRNGGPGFVYVKAGEDAPFGASKVTGSNMERYFHTEQGQVKAGEWYANDKTLATMLNNYTSKDYIRSSAAGRLYLGWRAAFGQWRLFGLFHTYAMSWMASASGMGLGIRGIVQGLKESDIGKALEGLREVGASPVAGIRNAMLGGELRAAEAKAGFNPDAFWKSDAGQALERTHPQARELQELLWKGGGRNMYRLDEIFRNRATESMQKSLTEASDAWARGHMLEASFQRGKALAQAPFAAISLAMDPLFEHWIPSLKLGTAYRDLAQSLSEKAADIAAGSITKEEVARQVVNRVEDFFGEMNADNLFLNNTMRTALQLYYRSFSWRFGTARSAYHALRGSGADIANWAGLALYTTAASMLAAYALTRKRPEASLINAVAPSTGVKDDRGKDLRFFWPNYMTDVQKIRQNPGGLAAGLFSYATGGQSDFLGSMLEAYRNKDFYGKSIVKPEDADSIGGLAYRFAHGIMPFDKIIPGTFMQRNVDTLTTEGLPKAEAWEVILAGGSPATRSTGLTPAETELQRLTSVNYSSAPMAPAEFERIQAMHKIESAVRNQQPTTEIADTYRNQGVLNQRDVESARLKGRQSYLKNGLENRYLSFEDALRVFEKGSTEEQFEMHSALVAKRAAFMREERDPKEKDRLLNQYRADINSAFGH